MTSTDRDEIERLCKIGIIIAGDPAVQEQWLQAYARVGWLDDPRDVARRALPSGDLKSWKRGTWA